MIYKPVERAIEIQARNSTRQCFFPSRLLYYTLMGKKKKKKFGLVNTIPRNVM